MIVSSLIADFAMSISQYHVYICYKFHYSLGYICSCSPRFLFKRKTCRCFSNELCSSCHLLLITCRFSIWQVVWSDDIFFRTSRLNDLTSRHNYLKLYFQTRQIFMLTCQIILLLSVWHLPGKTQFKINFLTNECVTSHHEDLTRRHKDLISKRTCNYLTIDRRNVLP